MQDEENDKSNAGVRTLSTAIKVLRVLDLIASGPVPLRLGEICNVLGLSRGTAYQQLRTLVESGWIEVREDGRYQLSLRCVSAAGAALRQMNLGERVQPILEKLVRDTRETVSITAIQDGQPVIIQRVEVDRPIVARQDIGTRLDLTTSASGKIHIVFNDAKAAVEIGKMKAHPLPTDEFERIRETRIAFSEPGTGLLAAATPILDRNGRCTAALSLVGLERRNDIWKSRSNLLSAAQQISILFSE